MPKRSILVIDDEVSIRKALSKALERENYKVTAVKSFSEAKAVSRDQKYDLVIVDLCLPDGDGLNLISDLKQQYENLVSILITGNATVESAIEATKKGVFYYVTKPFNMNEVIALVHKALEHLTLGNENQQLRKELNKKGAFDNFIGDSEPMVKLFRLIERVADTDSTVLISGESGTGKELVARSLHYKSSRSVKEFVPVNCGAIPAGLLESELFGHVKGAFTGASSNRMGRFQMAHDGTLFLDEIGEMPPDLQVKLLRVLQTKQFEPVGSVKSIRTDARIIAATNVDLEQAVIDKRFREDLFYRLNVIPIHIPALRDRRGDIPLLIHHFLIQYNNEKKCDVVIRDEQTMSLLMNYDWPGNVRELENLIQRLVILKQVGEVLINDLPEKICKGSGELISYNEPGNSINSFALPEDGINFKDIVTAFEDHLLKQALQRTSGNKNKASELLQMNRTTLVEKLKKRNLQM